VPFDARPDWASLLADRVEWWAGWLAAHPGSHATIDFETRSACDLKKHGSWIYSRHPSTEAMCLAYQLPVEDEPALWHPSYNELDEDETVLGTGEPVELFAFILAGGLVEAHNAFFERVIWLNVMVARHGWPGVGHLQWRCSASRASAASLPRDLENACQAMGLGVEKDMEGRRLMLQMSKPRKPRAQEVKDWREVHGDRPMPLLWHETREKLLRLFAYCRQDVRAEAALSKVLPELSPRELELWQLDQAFNERGVRFDLAMAKAALAIAEQNKRRLNAELFEMTGILKASQRQQVKEWLKEHEGVDLPDTAAETLDKFLEDREALSGRARRILEIVRDVNRTSTMKYQAALDKTDPYDWRARDLLMFHGANTGRWAGKGIQVQNFPRGVAKNIALESVKEPGTWYDAWDMDVAAADILDGNEAWIAATYDGGVMEALSTALRGMVIPSEGHDLMVADYAAIEARCVLWLAEAVEALQVFYTGGDIYCDMATGIYGYQVNKKQHPDERQFGKQAILGLGYGMGFITFLLTCRKYKIAFSVEQVQRILGDKYAKYHEWVKDYLFPSGEVEKSKRAQASKNRRRLTDAGEDPSAIIHELALMKYTVDVYRRRYAAVKDMWDAQEAAAISAVRAWQELLVERAEAEDEWKRESLMPRGRAHIMEDLKTPVGIKWRDAINGPEFVAGRIAWFVRGGFLCCRLPSGRLLRYRDPEVKATKTAWGETKDGLRYWTVVQPGNKWDRTSTYGGKLVENITQAVARDVMGDAMLRSRGTIYQVVMTVHDEMVAEVPQGEGSLGEFEALMSETEGWAAGCPVAAEAGRFPRYRK
jgi:DNA polymerase